MKQTAVEWLYDQLEFDESVSMDNIEEIFNQAKQMEKEQIIQARTTAPIIPTIDMIDYVKEAEQYYNEQYGQQQ